MQRVVLIAMVLGLSGCGGNSTRDDTWDDSPSDSSEQNSGGDTKGDATYDHEIGGFETPEALTETGLWMGTPLGNDFHALPIERLDPPRGESSYALHVTGVADDMGMEVLFHTVSPIEIWATGVRFSAKSDRPGGAVLEVTLGGPEDVFWSDTSRGVYWPAASFELSPDWQEYAVTFADLGFDKSHPSPHSDPFGALHFAMPPNQAFDFWLDDVVLKTRYP